MQIFVVISVLAFLALLWASLSIAHHIRRSRRLQREALRSVPPNLP